MSPAGWATASTWSARCWRSARRAACRCATARLLWPEPVLVGRNEAKLRDVAERHGLTDWTTDLRRRAGPDDVRDLLRRAGDQRAGEGDRAGDRGRQAHLHREAAGRRRWPARSSWPAPPTRPGVKHGVVQDKLFLPGLRKLKRLIDGGFFGRILSVRGEFGYWVFEGDWQPAQRPSLELPGRGRRRHRARHVPALALRAGAAVRAGARGHRARRHAHPAALGRAGRAVRGHRRRRRVRRSSSSRAASSRRSTRPGRSGSTATSWSSSRSTAPRAARSPGCAAAASSTAPTTPKPVWNPDLPVTDDFRDQWQEVPDNEEFDNGFKVQWEMFLRHVVPRTPRSPGTSAAGARGVQLAELGLQSAREGRRVEIPELAREPTVVTLPDGTRSRLSRRRRRVRPPPGPPFTGRIAYAAAHVVADPAPRTSRARRPVLDWDATLAFRRHLWSHGLRRGRGDGHRPARHGPGLPGRPRADPPLGRRGARRSAARSSPASAPTSCRPARPPCDDIAQGVRASSSPTCRRPARRRC